MQNGRSSTSDTNFRDYKGVIHVHTSLGGHSTGSFEELIDAANDEGLDFVLMSEHWSQKFDTSALTLNGNYGNTLFVNGNEIDTADGGRFLISPGRKDAAELRKVSTETAIELIHADNGLAIVAYPETSGATNSSFDGIEVLSLHTAAKKMNWFTAFLDMIWARTDDRPIAFASGITRPDENLRLFDEVSLRRKVTLFAGADAHSNLGVHLIGDDTGKKLLNIKADPYRTILRIVRIHILASSEQPLTRELLLETIKLGHFYIGLDAFGDPSGFSFTAEASGETKLMGDEVESSDELTLKVTAPVKVRAVVYKNGEIFQERSETTDFSFKPDTPGVYRVEAYLEQIGTGGERMPWIISNPIYVR
jgi:hypothetical protein